MKFLGYVRALKNYLRTPKARHDLKSYAQASAVILFTSLIVYLLAEVTQ